jgi:hypothetical protein
MEPGKLRSGALRAMNSYRKSETIGLALRFVL